MLFQGYLRILLHQKNLLIDGGNGHGCGHNLFGAASLASAIAIKEQIEKGDLKGTIKFFGTPSEEKFFGKIWMVDAGLWDDVDVNISWHPGYYTLKLMFNQLYH